MGDLLGVNLLWVDLFGVDLRNFIGSYETAIFIDITIGVVVREFVPTLTLHPYSCWHLYSSRKSVPMN